MCVWTGEADMQVDMFKLTNRLIVSIVQPRNLSPFQNQIWTDWEGDKNIDEFITTKHI